MRAVSYLNSWSSSILDDMGAPWQKMDLDAVFEWAEMDMLDGGLGGQCIRRTRFADDEVGSFTSIDKAHPFSVFSPAT